MDPAQEFKLHPTSIDKIYDGRTPGWHEGPYVLFGYGLMNTDKDTHVQTGENYGQDYSDAFGFTLGWHVTDQLAGEGQLKIAQNKEIFGGDQRTQWAISSSLFAKYSFFTQNFKVGQPLVLLPFARVGVQIYGLAVPGDSSNNDSRVFVYGPGAAIGGGAELISGDHLIFRAEVEGALIALRKRQVHTVTVVQGGVDPQINFIFSVGLKF